MFFRFISFIIIISCLPATAMHKPTQSLRTPEEWRAIKAMPVTPKLVLNIQQSPYAPKGRLAPTIMLTSYADFKKMKENGKKRSTFLKSPYFLELGRWHLKNQDSKIDLLDRMSKEKKRNPLHFYYIAQDRDLSEIIYNKKTLTKLHKISYRGKNICAHAIDHDDITAISKIKEVMNPKRLHKACRYAARLEKPQALLALLPQDPKESEEFLFEKFSKIKRLSLTEVDTYLATLKLIKQNKQKLLAHKKNESYANLQDAIQRYNIVQLKTCIQKDYDNYYFLPDNENFTPLPPDINQALQNGDIETVQAYSDKHKLKLKIFDVLELAAYYGNQEVLKILVNNGKYIDEEKQKKLLEIAQSGPAADKKPITDYIQKDLPKYIAQKNHELFQTLFSNRVGANLIAFRKWKRPNNNT